MFKDYKLSVTKIEGLGDTRGSEFSVRLNDFVKFSSSLEALPVTFKVDFEGVISLFITDKTTHTVLASVSFHTSLLKNNWFYWLPLFLSSDNYLTELTENISLPRILLGVNQEINLPDIYEISERSDSCDDEITIPDTLTTHLHRPILQNSKSESLQESFKKALDTQEVFKKQNESINKTYNNTVENLRTQLSKERDVFVSIYNDLKSQIYKYQEEIELERKYRLDMQHKLEKSLNYCEIIKQREKKFINIIEKKYSRQSVGISSYPGITVSPVKLVLEKDRKGIKGIDKSFVGRKKEFKSSLGICSNERISIHARNHMEIYTNGNITINPKHPFDYKTKDIFKKEAVPNKIEVCCNETINIVPEKLFLNQSTVLIGHRESFISIIERQVGDILEKFNLVGLLKKSKDINYLIGAKTITVCLKQGQVCCKNGTPLDSYIFKNCKPEIEALIRVKSSSIKRKSSSQSDILSIIKNPGFFTQVLKRC